MKLIHVNTFESGDYGIGVKAAHNQRAMSVKSPSKIKIQKKRNSSNDPVHSDVGGSARGPDEEFGKKKLIVKRNNRHSLFNFRI